jgi:hypothetical protein
VIYETDQGFSISSHGCWLPGIYDSERTARYAFRFENAVLQRLSEQICHIGNRLISMDDLRAAKELASSPGS